jgi:hypothetical protein
MMTMTGDPLACWLLSAELQWWENRLTKEANFRSSHMFSSGGIGKVAWYVLWFQNNCEFMIRLDVRYYFLGRDICPFEDLRLQRTKQTYIAVPTVTRNSDPCFRTNLIAYYDWLVSCLRNASLFIHLFLIFVCSCFIILCFSD